jgi:hypothetical protein
VKLSSLLLALVRKTINTINGSTIQSTVLEASTIKYQFKVRISGFLKNTAASTIVTKRRSVKAGRMRLHILFNV